ncbi:MAG: hypothetical protein Q8P80_00485 [Candidatus Levybacteria bacterium]|nr:hypothetical protein [Candidatus Levybacteria bacterium]
MSKPAQIHASTQKFTEIQDIVEDVIIFNNQFSCQIIEVQATNFALLSLEEQQTKIYAYASLLNSLSFPIQIVIQNKKVDISSYIKRLDNEIEKAAYQNEGNGRLGQVDYIKMYRDFVSEMVKVNSVLDKKFYIVVSFSYLEKGVKGVLRKGDFAVQAKQALHNKSESVLSQLARLSLRAKVLDKEELIKFFYEAYNQSLNEVSQIGDNIKTPLIKGLKGV